MMRTSRSATSMTTAVRACWRPRPMWWRRPLWRRVTRPVLSIRSWRTRQWVSPVRSGGGGLGGATVGARGAPPVLVVRVVAAAPVGVAGRVGGGGLGAGVVGEGGGGASGEGAVRSGGVVQLDENVQEALQFVDGGGLGGLG